MRLNTSKMIRTDIHKGLSEAQVEESRATYGSNIITPPPGIPLWKKFLSKFSDPLIIILLVAGAVSVGLSCYEYFGMGDSIEVFFEPVGIFMAIILATGLSFWFEYSADKEFSLLKKVDDEDAVTVMRAAGITEIPKRDVVKGDIVILSAGGEVPADGELIEAVSMNVDESSLTGEPICAKTTDPNQFDPDATFDSNRVMRGSKIMEGHGKMIVEAVGDHTEHGKVYRAAQIDNSVRTPLNIQLSKLGNLISMMSYVIGALVIVAYVVMFMVSEPWNTLAFLSRLLKGIMVAVTLVVVAVPEGLPMAVTLSLAYSMKRMLRTKNLVRKLHACETMGATTVICTDKTGTLTQNRMSVAEAQFFGTDTPDIYAGMALNSTAQLDLSGPDPKVVGNPTEGALLLWMLAAGADYAMLRQNSTVIQELPFSTERKYMATVARMPDGRTMLYVKGAPEIVMGLCSKMPDGVTPQDIDSLLLSYQAKAMRTLSFAAKELTEGETAIENNKVSADGLAFLGVVAIADPVRSDVPDAMKEVLHAGIGVKIVTGDTPGTAKQIGREVGLWDDTVDTDTNITTGPDIAAMTDEQLQKAAPALKIIARARPMDKKRLVEALQKHGDVVAVTGDGTNDAPALKAAHVGLSMGDGTAVAKEASDITITDNSFASIGRAVMWGRSLYQNIQRFILFQLTVNVVACLIVLAGSIIGMESPLTVTQMLWVNLIMDTFAAMALVSLPPSSAVMHHKPRSRSAFIITPDMYRQILGIGGLFFILLLSLLYYLEHIHITSVTQLWSAPFEAANKGLSPYELSVFFTVFVFMQFWNMFNARAFATGRSALHLKGCSGFLIIAASILVGQIIIVQIGGRFFSVYPLSFSDWAIIISSTSLVLWIGELARLFRKSE